MTVLLTPSRLGTVRTLFLYLETQRVVEPTNRFLVCGTSAWSRNQHDVIDQVVDVPITATAAMMITTSGVVTRMIFFGERFALWR